HMRSDRIHPPMRRRRLFRTLRAGIAIGSLVVTAGCALVLGLDPPGFADANRPDALAGDALASDGGPAADAGSDATAGDACGFFCDPSRWSTHTLPSGGYAPGAFDGKYVYFIR